MFLHRFKTEVRESRIILCLWLATLICLTVSLTNGWHNPRTSYHQSDFSGVLLLFVCSLPIIHTLTTAKLDDMKSPSANWITRPLRPFPLYGAKLCMLHLCYTLPLTLITFFYTSLFSSLSESAFFSFEVFSWTSFAINTLFLGALCFRGFVGALLIPATFILTIVIIAIVVNIESIRPITRSLILSDSQTSSNLLVLLPMLSLAALGGISYLLRNSHRRIRLIIPSSIAILSCALTFLVPLLSLQSAIPLSTNSNISVLTDEIPTPIYSIGNSSVNYQSYVNCYYRLATLEHQHNYEAVSFRLDDPTKLLSKENISLSAHIQSGSNDKYLPLDPELLIKPHWRDSSTTSRTLLIGARIPLTDNSEQSINSSDIPHFDYRDIKVEGTVTLRRTSPKEVIRTSLDKPFAFTQQNSQLHYYPKGQNPNSFLNSQSQHSIGTLTANIASLPLISYSLIHPTRGHELVDNFLFALQHRDTKKWIRLDDGSSSGGGGAFCHFSEHELQHPHHWPSDNSQPSFKTWKNQADLIVFHYQQAQLIEIPVEVTLRIPTAASIKSYN